MGHRSQSSLDQWQSRLGPVQRLNRCFLIGTQNHRMLGRVQIQAHHVDDFFHEFFVSADFERLGQMGFKTTGLPHSVHHRFIDAQRIGQRPNAPVRGMRRLSLSCLLNNQWSHLFSFRRLSATSRKILFNSRQALLDKPLPPSRHLATVNPQILGYGSILFSLCRHQNNLSSLHQTGRCPAPARPTGQRLDFTFSQLYRLCHTHGTSLLKLLTVRRRISSFNLETLH